MQRETHQRHQESDDDRDETENEIDVLTVTDLAHENGAAHYGGEGDRCGWQPGQREGAGHRGDEGDRGDDVLDVARYVRKELERREGPQHGESEARGLDETDRAAGIGEKLRLFDQ